jgi:hypothetical protein
VVSPLDNIRPTPGVQRTGPVARPNAPGFDFESALGRALENTQAPPSGDAAPAAPVGLGDDLATSLALASQSLQRATAHINSARAYFRNAAPQPAPDANAPSVDRQG